jgi:TetR/AcrR family transcriptional regulator, transcriptional repressor of bet genes
MSGLVFLLDRAAATRAAEGIAAMIDGLYIRHALKDQPPAAAAAIALVEDYLESKLSEDKVTP